MIYLYGLLIFAYFCIKKVVKNKKKITWSRICIIGGLYFVLAAVGHLWVVERAEKVVVSRSTMSIEPLVTLFQTDDESYAWLNTEKRRIYFVHSRELYALPIRTLSIDEGEPLLLTEKQQYRHPLIQHFFSDAGNQYTVYLPKGALSFKPLIK